jgi:phospholipid/cholesterol/gamma-HCH transport system substrate-binding protein
MSDDRQHRIDLKVGAFVVGGALLGLVIVLLLGRERHVFEPRVAIHTRFTDVQGLRVGAPVWLSGVSVGTVSGISFSAGGKVVRVDLELTRKFLNWARADSVARIDSQGLLGDKLVSL